MVFDDNYLELLGLPVAGPARRPELLEAPLGLDGVVFKTDDAEASFEVLAAADRLTSVGVRAGVVCLTSPDLVYRSFDTRGRVGAHHASDIAEVLFPAAHPAPLVTVMDGHPHTLSFLAGLRGDRLVGLGVREFGQSSDVDDAYRLHGIDTASIVDAALTLAGR